MGIISLFNSYLLIILHLFVYKIEPTAKPFSQSGSERLGVA
jgi:hypothetical protein